MHWSPKNYAESAVIAKQAGEELVARLDWVTMQPKRILDVGCGTGELAGLLKARYPDAQIIAVDVDELMADFARQQSLLSTLAASAEQLPFKAQTFDLICANLLLPWLADNKRLFKELRRLLSADGLLMFSTLGPDTLKEWQALLPESDLPKLQDMHDIGDILVQEKFADPVLDINYYTLSYTDPKKCLQELCHAGMLKQPAENYSALTFTPQDEYLASFEVIYAHAWMPASSDAYAADDEGVARIPLSVLRRSLTR